MLRLSRHLQKSSKSLEKTNICNIEEGVIDKISYAAIAKIRRVVTEIEIREQQQIRKSKSKPRNICMYTYEGAHASNLQQAIVDTWAAQCNGFFAVGLGAVDLNKHVFRTLSIWEYVEQNQN